VNFRHLCRWLVAIFMVVGVALGGAIHREPLAATETGPAGGIAATAAGWSGAEAIMPVKPQNGSTAAAHERSPRVKIPLLATAFFAAALYAAMVRRAIRRPDGPRSPLAVRVRSVPRRGPPHLSLG
jgi:hypothetical protein